MSEQPLERAQKAIDDAREAEARIPGMPPDDERDPSEREEPVSSPDTSPKPDSDSDEA